MRFAEAQVELLALDRRLKADALDLELFLEALVDAGDHIGDQRAGKAMKCLDLPALSLRSTRNRAALRRERGQLSEDSRKACLWGLRR